MSMQEKNNFEKAAALLTDTKPLEAKDGRRIVLASAINCVLADRNKAYGSPEQNFQNIANLWNAYLAAKTGLALAVFISPIDVAIMMDLVKTARLATNPTHMDSWIDKAGYSACGGDIAVLMEQDNNSQMEFDFSAKERVSVDQSSDPF